ncbi:neuropeptide SIFamide [Adelges cooleyi]|uniref:neuropeptide SIFamide n=1 Tax=Adelges cooleyi TaxID=133065 RepID=UPI0021802A0B|nr:neuropeptide SIFamide [Adelges cooleyi]
MNFKNIYAVFLMVVVLMTACVSAEAFRKPPFNGSIFGKRNSPVPEYDNPKQSIYTMCQIASEACQTWFPTVAVEKK